MAEETKKVQPRGDEKGKEFPPLTPPEPLSEEELKEQKRRARQEWLRDVTLGAAGSGTTGVFGMGMSVADLDEEMKEEK